MNSNNTQHSEGLTRRELLKASGAALGGLALGGIIGGESSNALAGPICASNSCGYPVNDDQTQRYDYTDKLDEFVPDTMQQQLDSDEMRITFLGSSFPPSRKAQQMMSIFVEVGPWIPDPNGGIGRATDSFVFDCGAGVITNYNAMGISYSRMDKVFITHLHADHMSDLSAIYCFGPAEDRKSPLYVWGQSPSSVMSPAWGNNPPKYYDDGLKSFCRHLRAAMRWHTESFSFLKTGYEGYPMPTRKSWGLPCDPVPVSDDPADDGYALIPIELNWTKIGGVAYHNRDTGVRITHFPVIHTRKGSMGYKLEWNGLTMIYTSDTRPEWLSVHQANNRNRGVDVFIHEMILPPEVLAMKNMGLTAPPDPESSNPQYVAGVYMAKTVIESSHSPQGAFGYLLSQISPHPRLTVLTHFPVANDTVTCAYNSVKAHCPWVVCDPNNPNASNIFWSTDLMVLRVKKGQIEQFKGKVSNYAYGPPSNMPSNQKTSKYHTEDGQMDPTAQLELATLIPARNPDGTVNYCENGY